MSIYKTTIGVDITPYQACVKETGEPIRFVLWDMSGQTHFARFRARFYTGTSGALVIYDISSVTSYRNISNWIKECTVNCRKTIPMVIVGNKADLKDLRIEHTRPSISDIPSLTTSAKKNWNVDQAFFSLFETIVGKPLEKLKDQQIETTHVSYESP